MSRDRMFAHIALLGVALIYGANYSIAKELLSGDFIGPMGLVFFRISVSLVLFSLVHFFFIKEKVERKDLWKIAICAMLGVATNQSFFITGLKYTTPINASVLMVTTPMLVMIISVIRKQESFSLRKIIGITLGASGTLLLIFGKGHMDFSGSIKGDLFIMINALAYATYLVVVKPLMHKYNPLTIVKWIFLFGLIPVIPQGFSQATQVSWHNFSPGIWLAFLYVLIFTTFFTYLLNAEALKRVKPSVVGVYIYLQPFLATLIALLMGQDRLSFIKILSGIVIIGGVYLASFNKKSLSRA